MKTLQCIHPFSEDNQPVKTVRKVNTKCTE